ncbi:MAG: diguanylate cyclase [Candidatus Gracilibacteria bacterium]|jgi:GGDEF domain-containing protein|nr:diguanylate cyclase [Candidatus Gracilibacteria bacterium]
MERDANMLNQLRGIQRKDPEKLKLIQEMARYLNHESAILKATKELPKDTPAGIMSKIRDSLSWLLEEISQAQEWQAISKEAKSAKYINTSRQGSEELNQLFLDTKTLSSLLGYKHEELERLIDKKGIGPFIEGIYQYQRSAEGQMTLIEISKEELKEKRIKYGISTSENLTYAIKNKDGEVVYLQDSISYKEIEDDESMQECVIHKGELRLVQKPETYRAELEESRNKALDLARKNEKEVDKLKIRLDRAQRAISMLLDHAQIDLKTGLKTREYLDREIQEHLLRSESQIGIFAVIIQNIESIKSQSEQEVADKLIKSIAQKLQKIARQSEPIAVFEEGVFANIIQNPNQDQMHQMLNKFKQKLKLPRGVEISFAIAASNERGINQDSGTIREELMKRLAQRVNAAFINPDYKEAMPKIR